MFRTFLTAAILAAQTTAPTTAPTTTTAPETIPEPTPEIIPDFQEPAPIDSDSTENENDFSEIENTDSIENEIIENSIDESSDSISIDDSQEFQEPETIPEEIPAIDDTFENPDQEQAYIIANGLYDDSIEWINAPNEPEFPELDTRFENPEQEQQWLEICESYEPYEPEPVQEPEYTEPEPVRTQSAYIPHDLTREDFPALQTIGYYPGKKPSYIVSVIVCEF